MYIIPVNYSLYSSTNICMKFLLIKRNLFSKTFSKSFSHLWRIDMDSHVDCIFIFVSFALLTHEFSHLCCIMYCTAYCHLVKFTNSDPTQSKPSGPSAPNAPSVCVTDDAPHPPDVVDSPGHVSTGRPPSRQGKTQAASTSPLTPCMNTRSRKVHVFGEFHCCYCLCSLFLLSKSFTICLSRPPCSSH